MKLTWLLSVIAAALVCLGLVQPAQAHPHIFIDAKVTVGFDDQGRIATLHNSWTFDTAFSVWMVQGLDTNGDGEVTPDEMQELADQNVSSLADFAFYTYAGDGMSFTSLNDQQMHYTDERVTLDFTIKADQPMAPGHRFELGIYDPEYYVAISFAGDQAVSLDNAPASCSSVVEPPKPMDPAVEKRLYSLGPEVLELPPDLAAAMRGTQGLIAISCAAAPPPATAVEAVNQMATPRTLPFGGPPPEVGLPVWRSGFMGWVQQQQKEFYAALTHALDAFRTDSTAFWVLGGLSFAYGIFHAAGPGHGKVVISSYVLANERQLRQGIALSALSALMQSLVAIVFVLVLAGALRLTSTAMGDAAYWVTLLSYVLVALMGVWLVLRKVFGWGHDHHDHDHAHDSAPSAAAEKRHQHAHALLYDEDDAAHGNHGHEHHHHHAHGLNHAHSEVHAHSHHGEEHGHHHHHAVTPADLKGGWREKLAVVLAVGLRPCSGALVVLVFALSQGVLLAGVVSVLLMGLGTAITVSVLATMAVTAKGLISRFGGGESAVARGVIWWAELAGAVAVLAFGIVLVMASL